MHCVCQMTDRLEYNEKEEEKFKFFLQLSVTVKVFF